MTGPHDRSARAPGLVVGIGASAGGLEAFKQLLAVLPVDSGMAFLLVQHLDPTHASLLSDLLAPRTGLPVRDAEQGERVLPDRIYVIRPGCALAVLDGRIELTEPTLHRGVRLPVDHLFRSLAREYGSRAVGIVLSGAGSDGSSGLRDIKRSGGLVVAQVPTSSGQSGMPQSAVDTGLVDLVLDIEHMPAALARFDALPPTASIDHDAELRSNCEDDPRVGDDTTDDGPEDAGRADDRERVDRRDLDRLAALLESRLGFDLNVYKRGTVERRVLRRMLLSGFEQMTPWLEHLRASVEEQHVLVRDLMISVTSFFRNEDAYAALREQVIAPLVAGAADGATVRVWVAGCATGEEAYSIGMELLDAAAAVDKPLELQIFATDVDQEALSLARTGIYPTALVEPVGERRLRRYFTPVDGRGYQVRSGLRDAISFASHDLTKDPPFSRMDLVTCRNVLIYLTNDAQAHVLASVHFALKSDGHLLLSTSETIGPQRELFATVSKMARLYRRVGTSRIAPVSRARRRQVVRAQGEGGRTEASQKAPGTARRETGDPLRRAVLDACLSPTVVVSEDGAVLFAHGELGPYLRFPQGDDPQLAIGECLRPEIATRVRGLLYRCRRGGETVTTLTSPDDENRRVRVVARPVPRVGDAAVVLSFEPEPSSGPVATGEAGAEPSTDAPADNDADARHEALVGQLEYELRATREDLRNTVEELEASNEELRSSNEESLSMNEELQSGNEELEATTEELRSLNEELTTLNAQLREKLDQLEQANDDLGNFFSSARVAIVFLDERLRIKRFTPAAATLLGIDHVDVGRFAGDIARELLQDALEQEAREVLDRLSVRDRELQLADGRWFARRILPYRTESRRIEGVVVTLVDITELKRAAARLAARERQQAVIARLGLAALRDPDLQGFMDQAVRDVADTLSLDYCKVLELQPGGRGLLLRAGIGWNDGIAGVACVENDHGSQAGFTLASRVPVLVDDLAAETRFSGPQLLIDHEVTSGLSCVILDGPEPYGVLGGHTRGARRFSSEDATFLQAVANVVGSAVSREQLRRRTALEHDVARALIGANDFESVIGNLQRCFAVELRAEFVELRAADPAGDDDAPLVDTLLHYGTRERRVAFEAAFGGRVSPGTDDIVERVLSLGRAVWMSDVGAPPLLTDDPGTALLGLRCAVGFPVCSRGRTFGAVALYSRERLIANDGLLRSLEGIGNAMGDFIARLELERRDARLVAITESSQDAILSHDHEGRITEWLHGAEGLFGYSAADIVGEPLDRLVPVEHLERARAIMSRVGAGERVEPYETERLARDGTLVEVSVTCSPIRDPAGNVVGVSSIERDIGRLKRIERELVAADRQKDEFLAMLGHELRNPLSSIRSAVELLHLEGGDESEMQRTRAILERQSAHMARLLDGLLDVSRIVQGKIALERATVDLAEVCREVIEDAAGRARDKSLELRAELHGAPLIVDGDRVRLVQVVDNLLSNAIRYTPVGGSIDVSLVRGDERAELRVRDDGIGIGAELLPRVFDVFRQAPRSLDRVDGGLGLGLSLVRALVKLHGGTVAAHSEGEGRGAAFTITLPLLAADRHPPVTVVTRTSASELDVLLVEDEPDIAEVLARVLRRLGHRVRHAADGTTAIGMAIAAPPDLVICDLGLPDGTSGYDVARALRAEPSTSALRLVALTGYGRPEDKALSREAGFDQHLVKPASIADLRAMLARERDTPSMPSSGG